MSKLDVTKLQAIITFDVPDEFERRADALCDFLNDLRTKFSFGVFSDGSFVHFIPTGKPAVLGGEIRPFLSVEEIGRIKTACIHHLLQRGKVRVSSDELVSV